jgi:hypothetical protein
LGVAPSDVMMRHEVIRVWNQRGVMLRNVITLFVLGSFVAGGSPPLSAQTNNVQATPAGLVRVSGGPLAPGGAAGIKQAQAQRSGIWNFVPFGLVGGLAALVVLLNDDEGDIATTTSGTN